MLFNPNPNVQMYKNAPHAKTLNVEYAEKNPEVISSMKSTIDTVAPKINLCDLVYCTIVDPTS